MDGIRVLFCHLAFLCLVTTALATPQQIEGEWVGILRQNNSAQVFFYELSLRVREGQSVSGTACSRSPDGFAEAYFEIEGQWDGHTLTLWEMNQTKPAKPRWCLKQAQLTWFQTEGVQQLKGDWTSKSCPPGQLHLQRKPVSDELVARSVFNVLGRWTGQIDQADRDYGFSYEVSLTSDGQGTATIVSEGNGGTATMALTWEMDEDETTLRIVETEILEKTDLKWKWCLKSATLTLEKGTSADVLTGDWQGYIEGYTQDSGPCAPGKMHLERANLTAAIEAEIQPFKDLYEIRTERVIKLDRVVEVSSPDFRIKVWDNGVVDGDIATIYLNGERIISKHRVTKRKRTVPVRVEQEDNLLVLHAEDVGDIPPNTVAVSVDDGQREQIVILTSNLNVSGALLIRHFRVN